MVDRIPNILLIDDDPEFANDMAKLFAKVYRIIKCHNKRAATLALQNLKGEIDLVVLDLYLESTDRPDGWELIETIKAYCKSTPIIVITGASDRSQLAVDSIKRGADDFIRKNEGSKEEWKRLFDKHLTQRNTTSLQSPQSIKTASSNHYDFVGETPEIKEIKHYLLRLSENPDVTVLITGETGVGKEVAARYLHRIGARKDKPFQAVHVSSMSPTLLESELFGHKKGAFTDARSDKKGAFERANGGILFLDEIGEIDPNTQVKLLRFLENKVITPVGGKELQVDIQILAATNRNLKEEIGKGAFREDLYHRLNHFPIVIPPLRDRPSDIPLIIRHYLEREGENEADIDEEVWDILISYHWPGNVRQLVNMLKSIFLKKVILGKDTIDQSLLPDELKSLKSIMPEHSEMDWKERSAISQLTDIEKALVHHGNKQGAAKELKLNLDRLRYLVNKLYNDHPNVFRNFPETCKRYKLNAE